MTWNVPNCLTIIRFLLVPFFLFFILKASFTAKLISLLIFIIAAITDFLDGKIARSYNQKSEFGKFADPLADKFLVAAAFIAFVQLKETLIPFWMVILILSREFVITGLRITALSKNMSIDTSNLGKAKTTVQMVSIIIILLQMMFRAYIIKLPIENWNNINIWTAYLNDNFWGTILQYTPLGLMSITTLLTVISGIKYFMKNKAVLFGEVK